MKIQACCAGYEGTPATVFAALEPKSDTLVISKLSDLRATRFEDCRMVSNTAVESWDAWFDETLFPEAIAAFMDRVNTKRIIFKPEAQRANPKTAIQLLKITEAGRQYEVSATVTNMQVAVLLVCWHLKAAVAIAETFVFGDMLESMHRGELWTA